MFAAGESKLSPAFFYDRIACNLCNAFFNIENPGKKLTAQEELE